MPPAREAELPLVETLERLLEIPTTDLHIALGHASDLVASALHADKVDAFVFEPERSTLAALGTSDQPLSELQRAHGLDRLSLANGGRTAEVFTTGQSFISGRVDLDTEELRGVKEALGVRSTLAVALNVAGERRGALVVVSQTPDFFDSDDLRFLESVARWIGVVMHQAELVQTNAEIAAAEGRRAVAEELVMVLAHDLRNQLAPITWRLTTMRERAQLDQREADIRELELGLKGLSRLGGLISDMLDVARIDQGVFTLDLQPVDLVTLTRETGEAFSTVAHPVQARAEHPLTVLADAARIRQCLENLISNAIKHSPAGSPVTTVVSLWERESGNWACVEVIDQGAGIPADLLPHIFERFTKGTPRRDGLGLGLYLAKRIAESHGGELTVESMPGHGARFRLSIPCAREV
jgi:two-component system, OmpR family, sensor kinase